MSAHPFEWPARFLDLKREIASGTTPERLTEAWNEVLTELAARTAEISHAGPDFIPQVNFADLDHLTPEEIDVIKRKGSLVVRGVVDIETASGWKTQLEEFVKANPHAEGFPEGDKQFFHLFWTRPQVQARAHPNVLRSCAWLNELFNFGSGKTPDGVDLSVPLIYADRFRIRHPGGHWGKFPPHVDGSVIARWENETFRHCFEDIFTGNWRKHDPYALDHRLDAWRLLCGRPTQPSMFRTFQGWLAMSETGPTQGTLRVFPEVELSNAYFMLRPFFRPNVPEDSPDILDPEHWEFDISTAEFPGDVYTTLDGDICGPQPTPASHPHLRLETTITSIPKVSPGDMVFWHCDTIHSVETEHTGNTDSAVMYISAVPKAPHNSACLAQQALDFLAGQNPSDFHKLPEGTTFVGFGTDEDVKEPIGRVAMGLPPVEVA